MTWEETTAERTPRRRVCCRPGCRDAVREAHLFLTALMSGYRSSPDRRLEIRCRGDRAPGVSGERRGPAAGPRCWYPLTPDALWLAAQHAVRWGHNRDVYCGVLPRQGERGGRFDSPELAWLWVDVDGGDAGPRAARDLILGAGIPEPHLAVLSGGGIHAYWRLSEPVELREHRDFDLVKGLLARLVRKIGGAAPGAHADSSRADTASILRIPGTWNLKKEHPRVVRLVQCRMKNPAHSYAWWTAYLPAARANPFPPLPPFREGSEQVPAWILPWLRQPAVHGCRHKELVRVAAILARDCGLPHQAILPLLEQKAAISPGPPMDRQELEKIAGWAGRPGFTEETAGNRAGRSTARRSTAGQSTTGQSTAGMSTAGASTTVKTTGGANCPSREAIT